GGWVDHTDIPADKSWWGTTPQMRDRSDARVRAIVEDLAKAKHADGSIDQKIGDFYAAYLDEAAIDKAGLAQLQSWLAMIDAAKPGTALARQMGRLQGIVDTPLALAVWADPKSPGTYQALVWQDGLGLPDRDYYLQDDPRFVAARAAYLTYLETLFTQVG